MSVLDQAIRTISCDGCEHKLMYEQPQHPQQPILEFQKPENAWVKQLRVVSTFDGRNFAYCSDECELKGVEKGKHNLPTIIQTGTQAAVNDAAKFAEQRQQADAAIRDTSGEVEKKIHAV